MMPKALDLTNQRFGRLVALEKAPSRNKKTYWKCRCDCGKIKEIQTSHLTSGAIQSCGCLALEKNPITNNSENMRNCIICNAPFTTTNYKRNCCFNCIPQGLSQAEVIKLKDRLLKHKLIEYKGSKCEICGYNKCEGALQFHHLKPEEKSFTISKKNLSSNFPIANFYKEVDKCILVCANCHAEMHYDE